MGLIVVTEVFAPLLAPGDPFALSGETLSAPSTLHLMGTDALGRDLLSGVLHGTRTSLIIAASTALLAFACGITVGMVAGAVGGFVDNLLMRATELFQVLPRFFLVALTIALFGPGIDRVVLTLGLTSWPVLARVVRGEVVSLRNLEFVLASEALGASRTHIIVRVLLPHVMPSVLVLVGLIIGQVMLVEASLGFLGLGDPNTVTVGNARRPGAGLSANGLVAGAVSRTRDYNHRARVQSPRRRAVLEIDLARFLAPRLRRVRDSNPQALAGASFQDWCNSRSANPPALKIRARG